MNKKRLNIIFSFAFLICLAIGSLLIGSETISLKNLFKSVFDQFPNATHRFILLEIRLPRVLTALLAGAGLSVSGLLMQTYFRNSLAGPSILGTTSGASFGVALTVLSSSLFGVQLYNSGYSITIASILGSMGVLFFILMLATRVGNGVILLIIGIILSSFLGATVTILQYFTDAENIQKYILWTMGSTNATTLQDVALLASCILLGGILILLLIKPLNALLIGEDYAKTLGINIKKSRFLIILSTGILTGGITAFCGPIAFIGLAVPHLVKIKSKSANHNYLIPLTAITGGIIMLIADAIAQVPFREIQLPINAVTSLIAAPIIIFVILKYRNTNG
ncbi:MAG: iron ABC transporter permease [Flavobacteriales bacterium]|nr:iron ABC transporter permease [Flavobacteriales bacterium]